MTLDQIRWLAILVLAVFAIIQFIYWLMLTFVSLPGRQQSAPRERIEPIMPTNPQGVTGTATGGSNSAVPVSAPEVIGKMVVLSGLANVSEIPLPSSNFGVGRFYNPDQDILVALDERSISRRHATFSSNPSRGEYYITDVHSSYGTVIRKDNKTSTLRGGQQERIYNGDIVQFGNVVTVRFVLPGETRGSVTRV